MLTVLLVREKLTEMRVTGKLGAIILVNVIVVSGAICVSAQDSGTTNLGVWERTIIPRLTCKDVPWHEAMASVQRESAKHSLSGVGIEWRVDTNRPPLKNPFTFEQDVRKRVEALATHYTNSVPIETTATNRVIMLDVTDVSVLRAIELLSDLVNLSWTVEGNTVIFGYPRLEVRLYKLHDSVPNFGHIFRMRGPFNSVLIPSQRLMATVGTSEKLAAIERTGFSKNFVRVSEQDYDCVRKETAP